MSTIDKKSLTQIIPTLIIAAMKNLTKIRVAIPASLRKHITDTLRQSILDGEIKPGERINELFISEKLGISRSPLREAIRDLEAEGFIKTYERRGSFVKKVTPKDIDEVFLVLSMIDPDSAVLAVENIKSDQKRKLKSNIKRSEKFTGQTTYAKVNKLSRAFHRIIAEATHNELLIKIRTSLRSQEDLFHRAHPVQELSDAPAAAMKEHIAIGNAILEGDSQKARALMVQHIVNAKQRAIRVLKKRNKGADVQQAV